MAPWGEDLEPADPGTQHSRLKWPSDATIACASVAVFSPTREMGKAFLASGMHSTRDWRSRFQLAIEEALKRRSEREAQAIKIDVEDGTVKVSGAVHSWVEREAVLGATRGTPGVRKVEESLRIEL